MTNPFHDWRNPARPCMWSKDYYKHDHVKRINELITHYQDGLLTTAELANGVFHQYSIGYTLGLEDANYPVPAIPVRVKHGSWFVIVQDAIHLSVYFWAMKSFKRYGFIGTRNRHSCYE